MLGSVQNVLNAVFIRATPQQAAAFEAIPGVRRLVPSRSVEFNLDGVADVVRLESARARPSGSEATGEGVRIAVIDSGLDFLHAAFQDDSLPLLAGYPKGRPEHLGYASNKIVAVRSYMHLQNSRDPATSTPDDTSPMDFSGHGTAVAMIAAGARVESPAGPVAGVAPRAYLGVYKVSGTPGIKPTATSQALIAAIDDAVVDGMDILNLSLGQVASHPWNSHGAESGELQDTNCDPLAVAAQSAVMDFGRVVVASAGNSGSIGEQSFPARNTVTSPAIAPDVIAVAATGNSKRFEQSVRIGGTSFPALTGSGPAVDQALTVPALMAVQFGEQRACAPFPRDALWGSILVAERGECWFMDKVENAAAAGAVGVVIFDDDPFGELVEMSSLGDTDIPAYFVSAASGTAISGLTSRASVGEEVSLTLDAAPLPTQSDWTSVASFSSRGPTPGLNLKPDVAAPGIHVYTADAWRDTRPAGFSPSGFRQIDGTSAAAPVVAGAAALVWQRNPSWTAREVSSALINTSRPAVVENGEPARVGSVGSGLLDIEAALDPIATVEPPTIGFGWLSDRSLPVWQEILVTNRSREPRRYRILVVPRDSDARAGVTLDGFSDISFPLAPSEYVKVKVSLEGLLPVPGSYEGHLRVTQQGSSTEMRVPYLYVVGDNLPDNSFAITSLPVRGVEGEQTRKYVVGKFVDRFGAPVAGALTRFDVREGDVRIVWAQRLTDAFGVAAAEVEFGPAGRHTVVASVGGVELPFELASDVVRPSIDEVVNDASLESGRPIAPGSLATIFGAGFAEFDGEAPISPLPVELKSVSVSFDFPEAGLSVPGRVFAVTPAGVGVQVPWELAGFNFAYAKVRVLDRSGEALISDPVIVELADVAPGLYVYQLSEGGLTSAWHPDGNLVTRADPARSGRTVSILMTGTGPFAQALQTGMAAAEDLATLHNPVVMVGGVPARVTYSGAVPHVAGLSQVDIIVPAAVPVGDLELTVWFHGSSSNVGTLPVQ